VAAGTAGGDLTLIVESSCNAVERVAGRLPYQPLLGSRARDRCSFLRTSGVGTKPRSFDPDARGRREASVDKDSIMALAIGSNESSLYEMSMKATNLFPILQSLPQRE
jgi:hypothetical protein